MEKVAVWVASYRTATRTWSTKACAKWLPHTWLWTEAGRNETRRTYRAPLTQALLGILQSFAEAFANALAVRPCRNRTEICLLAATKRAGGRRRSHGWAIENLPVRNFLYSADLRNI